MRAAMARPIARFPWELLDVVPKSTVRLAGRLRSLAERTLALDLVARSLEDALAGECHLVVERLSTGRCAPPGDGLTLHFDLDGLVASLWFEGDLAAALVARVLDRAAPFASPEFRNDPSTAGAVAAIVVEVCRRCGHRPVCVRREPPPDSDGVHVALSALIDERPYRFRAWACATDALSSALAEPSLEGLRDVPISLPLVASTCVAEPDDLRALVPGDVFMPGSWTARAENRGTARDENVLQGKFALAAPDSDRGVWVDSTPDGKLVLSAHIAALPSDPTETETPMEDVKKTLAEAVLDAPIVVRVELGAVTLSARQWSELRPGDVLETGRRLNAPAILRVAGREVARGELVNVDGELGVRIRQIVEAGEPQ